MKCKIILSVYGFVFMSCLATAQQTPVSQYFFDTDPEFLTDAIGSNTLINGNSVSITDGLFSSGATLFTGDSAFLETSPIDLIVEEASLGVEMLVRIDESHDATTNDNGIMTLIGQWGTGASKTFRVNLSWNEDQQGSAIKFGLRLRNNAQFFDGSDHPSIPEENRIFLKNGIDYYLGCFLDNTTANGTDSIRFFVKDLTNDGPLLTAAVNRGIFKFEEDTNVNEPIRIGRSGDEFFQFKGIIDNVRISAGDVDGGIVDPLLYTTIDIPTDILVSEITINSVGGSNIVQGQTSQMSADVLPENATDKTVVWSVMNGTGEGTIDQNGLFAAVSAGTVTVQAVANDASGITATFEITVKSEVVPVSQINVTSAEGDTITVGQTSQMSAVVWPEDATDPTFAWSVVNGTGEATIDQTGLLTAVSAGTVTVQASANDESEVIGASEITIEAILVSGITISSAEGTSIKEGETSQMSAVVLPEDTTDPTFVWSVASGTGEATIDQTGLFTAVSEGTVTVEAVANDGSGITGALEITIEETILDLHDEAGNIITYPNPFKDKLHLDNYRSNTVEIIDPFGRRFSRKVIGGAIDLSDLKEGVYLIRPSESSDLIRAIKR